MLRNPFLVLVAWTAVLPFSACNDSGDDFRSMEGTEAPGTEVSKGEGLDPMKFVEEAASSGMYEVQASELVLNQQPSPAVEQFAQLMIQDHKKANEQLRQAAQQADVIVPARMLKKHQDMLDQLRDLQGEELARTYREQQLKAHEEAVDLFERASDQLLEPALDQFAEKTLPTLQQHLDHVKELEQGS